MFLRVLIFKDKKISYDQQAASDVRIDLEAVAPINASNLRLLLQS